MPLRVPGVQPSSDRNKCPVPDISRALDPSLIADEVTEPASSIHTAKPASMRARVLKNSTTADLPVQQVVKIELVMNLATAKALGLNIPRNLLTLADGLIE